MADRTESSSDHCLGIREPASPQQKVTTASSDALARFACVRCLVCGNDETKVVDSRAAEDGTAIRRRRACTSCERRFTTFERLEVVKLFVAKRSGGREPFDGQKVLRGVAAAAKGRPVGEGVFEAMVDAIEEAARTEGAEVTSEWVGLAVLDRLRAIDPVTCLRFASVYKDFNDIGDFEREMSLIKLGPRPARS